MRTYLRLAASLLACLVCAAGAAGADVYRWTDDNGQLHFTSDLSQVPARYRDQAATPAESKSTFNEVDAPEATTAAPGRQAQPASEGSAPTTPKPASTYRPIPRIRTDGISRSEGSRMDDFEEKEPEKAAAPAKKYIRDCDNAGRAGRCRAYLNQEWVSENEAKKAKEAAGDEEE